MRSLFLILPINGRFIVTDCDTFNHWPDASFDDMATAQRYVTWADRFKRGETSSEFGG